jgi:hypothetical protein
MYKVRERFFEVGSRDMILLSDKPARESRTAPSADIPDVREGNDPIAWSRDDKSGWDNGLRDHQVRKLEIIVHKPYHCANSYNLIQLTNFIGKSQEIWNRSDRFIRQTNEV